jgi:hypothetical protein
MKGKLLFALGVLLVFGLVIMGCPTDSESGGQDTLTMSDYIKYVTPENFDNWGDDGSGIIYRLNVAYREEITAAFYKENSFVADPRIG